MPAIITVQNYPKSPAAKQALDDAYQGRWIYVDRHDHRRELRESPLANTFFVNWKRPHEAVERYRRNLWTKIQRKDKQTLDALRAITPTTVLVCKKTFNKKEHNYASVIFKAAEYVRKYNI